MKRLITFIGFFIVLTMFNTYSWANEKACSVQHLPSEVKADIDNFVALGNSLTGQELAEKLWSLGVKSPYYGSYMQGQMSPEQIKQVYLYRIEQRLLTDTSLTQEQITFLTHAKTVTNQAFNEGWDDSTPEFKKFVIDGQIALGVVTFSDVFGDLWPRVSSERSKPECNCATNHYSECNYSPNMCRMGGCEVADRRCGNFGMTLCNGVCMNIQ